MKRFITRNDICRRYTKVYKAVYGSLQTTLKERTPSYYNAGVYGWNYDVYEIDPWTCIITGYRMPVAGQELNYFECEELEDIAEKEEMTDEKLIYLLSLL